MKRRGAVNERVSMRSLAQYRMTIWWIRDFLAALCCPGVGVPGSFRTTCATGWTGRRGCRDRWHEKIKHVRPGPQLRQTRTKQIWRTKEFKKRTKFSDFLRNHTFSVGARSGAIYLLLCKHSRWQQKKIAWLLRPDVTPNYFANCRLQIIMDVRFR